VLSGLLGAASLVVWADPASAVVPGVEGRIACEGLRPSPNSEVFTIKPDGNDEKVLTDFAGRDGDPSWSPDGTKIAFESFRSGSSELWTMNADGTNKNRLTFNGGPEDRSSSWSPDGSQIVYHTTEFVGFSFEVMIINADGNGKTRLTENTAQDSLPSWSPDGTKIAFNSTRDGNPEIYVINTDGSDPTRLTSNQVEDAHPQWSPDGSHITFHTRQFGSLDIVSWSPTAPNPRLVTAGTEGTSEYFPVWSPDATRISYTGNTINPNFDVYTINVDGTGVTRLTSTAGFDGRCDWGSSP